VAREICFCGWVGELEDREPVYAGDGEWGLGCPNCGHLDRLEAWSEAEQHVPSLPPSASAEG
jgi:hypothetical protein